MKPTIEISYLTENQMRDKAKLVFGLEDTETNLSYVGQMEVEDTRKPPPIGAVFLITPIESQNSFSQVNFT